jgi:hypothetical protein
MQERKKERKRVCARQGERERESEGGRKRVVRERTTERGAEFSERRQQDVNWNKPRQVTKRSRMP